MLNRSVIAASLACFAMACHAQSATPFDAASAFGALPTVDNLRISPDGNNVVYISPAKGRGSVAYTLSLAQGSTPKAILLADGNPFRVTECHWVANDRLVCMLRGVQLLNPAVGGGQVANISRTFAVDADGKNLQMLSNRQNEYTQGLLLGGGTVIDWLPDENGAVLMTRLYLPQEHMGSRTSNSSDHGLGVDRIDTRSLSIQRVEPPVPEASRYISDGRGTVRIMGLKEKSVGKDTGTTRYMYRLVGSRDWRPLGNFDTVDGSGFYPQAVDHDRNIAYGYKKKNDHYALYSVTLDEALHEEVVYDGPDVNVRRLIYLGRDNRAVGAAYTHTGGAYFFSPDINALITSLQKALPNQVIAVVDSTLDQNRLVVRSNSATDPGVYYIFDKKTRQLQTFLAARRELEGVALAHVQSMTYPASDGTQIQAFLTLPPGREDAKNLPAIVLPHSDSLSSDEWGFGWLPEFFAARGFAVLQPNFRGSSGSGATWIDASGIKSWRVAVGDVSDAGRWLVQSGIADPNKLAVVGWSNGGYAALESAVVNPDLFKAVVAIAPVSDLAELKEDHRHWSDFRVVSDFVGEGAEMREGSPIEQAAKFKAPVLLFHGGLDATVNIQQSKSMAARLNSVGGKCELVTFDTLDHQLEDSEARTQMLRKSDEFLRKSLGM